MSGVDGFMAVERKFGGDLGRRLADKLRDREDSFDFEVDPAYAISAATAILKQERDDREALKRMEERHERMWGTPRPKNEAALEQHVLAYTRARRERQSAS